MRQILIVTFFMYSISDQMQPYISIRMEITADQGEPITQKTDYPDPCS